MTDAQLKIMIKAVSIQREQGMSFEDIFKKYPKLTDTEKAYIQGKLGA